MPFPGYPIIIIFGRAMPSGAMGIIHGNSLEIPNLHDRCLIPISDLRPSKVDLTSGMHEPRIGIMKSWTGLQEWKGTETKLEFVMTKRTSTDLLCSNIKDKTLATNLNTRF